MIRALPSPDRYWMGLALEQAELAARADEVPVGAVLVSGAGELLAAAGNSPIACHDPTAHAEVRVLRLAGQRLANYRLPQTTLYVTLEPCPLCAGALVQARVARVVFAAADPRSGCGGSVLNLLDHPAFNHRCRITQGVCEAESRALLQHFFRLKRLKTASQPLPRPLLYPS